MSHCNNDQEDAAEPIGSLDSHLCYPPDWPDPSVTAPPAYGTGPHPFQTPYLDPDTITQSLDDDSDLRGQKTSDTHEMFGAFENKEPELQSLHEQRDNTYLGTPDALLGDGVLPAPGIYIPEPLLPVDPATLIVSAPQATSHPSQSGMADSIAQVAPKPPPGVASTSIRRSMRRQPSFPAAEESETKQSERASGASNPDKPSRKRRQAANKRPTADDREQSPSQTARKSGDLQKHARDGRDRWKDLLPKLEERCLQKGINENPYLVRVLQNGHIGRSCNGFRV
jgi:hypothetical protein